MRHRRKTVKLQRRTSHRTALLKNLCKSLIEHRRIRTTLAKAKALGPIAEKLVTLGKKALAYQGKTAQETAARGVHLRRQAFAKLRDETLVKKLFDEIAVASKDRVGGYTRITKLGQRMSDSAPMAFIEWVDSFAMAGSEDTAEAVAEAMEAKPKKSKKTEKADAPAAEKKPRAPKKKKAEE
jgi:large subunit ribosomal protein L17